MPVLVYPNNKKIVVCLAHREEQLNALCVKRKSINFYSLRFVTTYSQRVHSREKQLNAPRVKIL